MCELFVWVQLIEPKTQMVLLGA